LSGGGESVRIATNTIMCNALYASGVHLPVTSFAAPASVASSSGRRVPESSTMRLYPNPARDVATLTLGLAFPTEVRITIYDLCGRVVRSWLHHAEPAGTLVAVDDLPVGIYLLRVASSQTVATAKLVKVR